MADIELTQVLLGLTPYVLIEMEEDPDDPGEPLLKVKAGGGAAEHPWDLVVLAVSSTQPEGNPVAEALRRIYRETGPTSTGAGTVEKIAREFNEGWLEFVTAD